MTLRSDPLPVLTGTAMRAWEERVFQDGRISERVVLESAGRAVARAIATSFPDGRVVGAIGGGNNGGDALVALRTLCAWGREVAAFGPPGMAARYDLTHGWTIPFHESAKEACRGAAVLLDGLLGTGASGSPRAPMAAIIEEMNRAPAPIVAVDGPSGVDLSTGRVEGVAVRADLTVTFGALKQGLLLYPAREYAGRILLAEVGFPPLEDLPSAALITEDYARAHLSRVPPDAHKGRMGIVAILAGRGGYAGAAIMAAMGALRAGAGGVRLVSTEDNRALLQTGIPEALFIERSDGALEERLKGSSAVLVGPGIGTDDDACRALIRVLELGLPTVVDADGITLIANHPELRPLVRRLKTVLTPHPAELGRLLGLSTQEVLAARVETARRTATQFEAVVLAKGTPSLVASPDGLVLFGSTGHSGLATGGMGDTLGGIIAAFLASGMGLADGAAVALHFAGRAAELAGRGRGLLPRDVAEALPRTLLKNTAVPADPPFLYDLPAPA